MLLKRGEKILRNDSQFESLEMLIKVETSELRKLATADNIDLDDVISCAYRLKRYKKMRNKLKLAKSKSL